MLPIVINILLAIHVLVCFLLVFVVLLQRPRSEGLGSAFGGGVTDNMFGAQTSNVLAKFTVWLAGGFFVLTLVLSMLYAMRSQGGNGSSLVQELGNEPAPQAEVTPDLPATGQPAETGSEATEAEAPAADGAPDSTAPATSEPPAVESSGASSSETSASDTGSSEPAATNSSEPAATPAGN